MVRKAIVKDLCDVCLDETGGDIEQEADYCMVIQLNNGGRSIEIDLCRDHAISMSVQDMIDASRTSESKDSPKQKKTVQCPLCGKYYAAGSGIGLHIKSKHREEWDKRKVIVTA